MERVLVEKDARLAREEETVADLRRRLDDAHAKLLPPPVTAPPLAPPLTVLARLRGLLRPGN